MLRFRFAHIYNEQLSFLFKFHERIGRGLEKVLKEHEGKTICIVSHKFVTLCNTSVYIASSFHIWEGHFFQRKVTTRFITR